MTTSHFYIYAENWPAGEHVATTGLDRALVPICESLSPLNPLILLKPPLKSCVRQSLHSRIVKGARRASYLALLFDDLRMRVGRDYDGQSRASGDLRQFIERGQGVLFSVLGGNGRAYLRAAKLAQDAGVSHVIYSVDDPIAWAEERRHKLPQLVAISPEVEHVLKTADAVITISDQLASSFETRFDRRVSSLPLPYVEGIERPITRRKRQVIYVGNVSHLYADAFSEVLNAVGAIRAKGVDVVFRATCTEENVAEFLPVIPDYLLLGRIPDRESLYNEISASVAAVCPISFDPSQEMVRTSFPSKLLDYLACSKAIVVHGPLESAAARYFEDNGLGYLSTSQTQLEETLLKIVHDEADLGHIYKQCLRQNHGADNFLAGILAAIKENRTQ